MWPITADSPLKQKQITAEIDTRTKLDAPFLIVTSWILVFVVKSPFSAILRKEGCPNIVQLNQAKKRGTKTKCSSSDSTVPVVTSVQLRSPCSFWTTLRNTALSLNYQNQSVRVRLQLENFQQLWKSKHFSDSRDADTFSCFITLWSINTADPWHSGKFNLKWGTNNTRCYIRDPLVKVEANECWAQG